jgi:hypothetical protein
VHALDLTGAPGRRNLGGVDETGDDRGWIVDLVGEATFARLARELPGSQLQSLLLEVMGARATARAPAEVLAQYQRDRFCAPAAVDQRTLHAVEGALLAAAEGFEALELSPVAPLGACSTVAVTGQHRVLSALRSTEIVADPTNVLALECAARMRSSRDRPVHLATSQRVIRAQAVPPVPGFSQHFRIFVLASGGVETRDHGFTVAALTRHVRTMLAALDRLERGGFALGARRIDVLATRERAALGDRIADDLGAIASRKLLEHSYYSGGLRYMLWVTAPDGEALPLADGGAFDWLARLTANRRAVYVASGLGAQLVPARFRSPGRLGELAHRP